MTMAVFLAVAAGALLLADPVHAQLSVTPITWDVVGLDSNRPDTSGPKWFPVGAKVCNVSGSAISDVSVSMEWAAGSSATYIINRPGSLTTLNFASIAGNACVDAYFEIELQNRNLSPFGQFRRYTIVASAPDVSSASTPAGRQIFIERLVSQNRNTTNQIRYCDPSAGGNCNPATGGTGWVVLGAGGSINLAVGNEYFIELTSQTATAYEELESFITLSNTIFQILSVSTTYSTRAPDPGRVLDPNPQLWADGCLWDSDPASTNYSSCLSSGKVGGTVKTLYNIRIVSGGGESVTLEALHYDRSGGSFHYNTDYSQSPGDAEVFDPTDAGIAKRFIPTTIAADGTATLVLTISNPNPVTVSGYNFVDPLPSIGSPTSQMRVAATPAAETFGCGSPTFAPAANDTSLSFSNGTVGPSGTCTIRVNVTVPLVGGATYPLTLTNVSNNLFVGSTDTGHAATATLQVTATPPPPQVCTRQDLAGWSSFSSASAPTPTLVYTAGVASAVAGTGLTYAVPGNDEWTGVTNTLRTLAAARTAGAYFEFRLNTTGLDEVYFQLRAWRQNGNAPDTLTLDYGPAGSLQESITFVVPEQNAKPDAANFVATNLTANLNPSGETVFRVYAYNDSGNSPIRLDDVLLTGIVLNNCTTNPTPPNPPTISKVFSPDPIRVGGTSTLTFTVTNPNTTTALNEVTFRDELPAGMTAVGSFVNNCSAGSSWGTSGGNTVVLFSGGRLAASASCTLSVTVTSSTIGDSVNISDPVDARETLPGTTATDTLTVLPPPQTPSIFKLFDPNPLLDPAGSSRLTFRITNNDPTVAIASVAFTDLLPAVGGVQMVAATPFSYLNNGNCGVAHSFTWNGTSFTLSFSGGAIPAGAVCELSTLVRVPGVDVSGGAVLFPNQTSQVSHVFNGTTYYGNEAKATLLVDQPIPKIDLLKEVGLTNDPDNTWFKYLVVTPGTPIFYKITVENIGEVALSDVTIYDPPPPGGTVICGPSTNLPVASALNDNHIKTCIVGPVTALEGTFPNTASATGTYSGTPYSASSTATYKGQKPTAVVMGQVELVALKVAELMEGVGAAGLDRDGLLGFLRAWDPAAAGSLERASREELLAALTAYLDPDRDGHVVVLRWETLEERGTVGFFAERLAGGGWVRIYGEMLPGLIASPMGAEYWLADPGARPGDGYQYRLIEVEAKGTTREYGPFDLRAGTTGK